MPNQTQTFFMKIEVIGRRMPSDGELGLAIIEKVNFNGKGLGWRIMSIKGTLDPEAHSEERYRQGIMHGGQQAEQQLLAQPGRLRELREQQRESAQRAGGDLYGG